MGFSFQLFLPQLRNVYIHVYSELQLAVKILLWITVLPYPITYNSSYLKHKNVYICKVSDTMNAFCLKCAHFSSYIPPTHLDKLLLAKDELSLGFST